MANRWEKLMLLHQLSITLCSILNFKKRKIFGFLNICCKHIFARSYMNGPIYPPACKSHIKWIHLQVDNDDTTLLEMKILIHWIYVFTFNSSIRIYSILLRINGQKVLTIFNFHSFQNEYLTSTRFKTYRIVKRFNDK